MYMCVCTVSLCMFIYMYIYFNTVVLEVPAAPLTPGSADSRASSLSRNGTLQPNYPTSPQQSSSPSMIAASQPMMNYPQMTTNSLTQMEEPGDYIAHVFVLQWQ